MIDHVGRLGRDEYDRLVEAGAFERQRIELVRGELRPMSPIGVKHSLVVTRLYRLLDRAAPAHLEVRSQQPLACTDDSEPEPDLSVVPYDPAPVGHPTTALLVIEVAETSLAYDLGDKADLYEDSDVQEYWVIDLVAAIVHVHRGRIDGRWSAITLHHASERLTPIAMPEVAVALSDLIAARA